MLAAFLLIDPCGWLDTIAILTLQMVKPQLRVFRRTKGAQLGRGKLRFATRPVFELLKRPLYCMWKGFANHNLETANQSDSKAQDFIV